MQDKPTSPLDAAQKARLKSLVFTGRIILFWERALPFLLRPAGFISLFLIMAWFGAFETLPGPLTLIILLLLLGLGLFSLIPLARQRYPERKEAIARLDRQEPHRVIATLSDRLGLAGSATAYDLWQMHQAKLLNRLKTIRLFRPHPDVARADKYGLRFLAILCLALGAIIAGPARLSKLNGALEGIAANVAPPRLDAWITPPSYTGRAPVLLDLDKKKGAFSLNVPQGSLFTLRTATGQGIELKIGGRSVAAADNADGTKLIRFEQKLDASGGFYILHYGRVLGEGSIIVEPDLAPRVTLTAPVQVMLGKSIRLRVKVQDDYGVKAAEARCTLLDDQLTPDLRLNKDKPAQPLIDPPRFPLALGINHPREAQTSTIKDLSDHPFAGLPMHLTVIARDDAGNEGIAETERFILPSRPFSKPAAQVLIALRQMLARDKRQRDAVSSALDLIIAEPETHLPKPRDYLQVSAIRAGLAIARDDENLRAVLVRMWDAANSIENGDLSEAERALAEAQAALERAIENGAGPEEISKLMQNLRQAMAEYLRQMQNRAAQNAPNGRIPPNMKVLTEADLEQMMKRIEQLSRSGAKDAARQQLQNLRDLLNALRNSDPSASNQASAMQRQLDDIAGLMREQQKLMDKTFQERNRSRQQTQPGANPQKPQAPGDSPGLRELEQKQGELRGKLKDLKDKLPQNGEGTNKAMDDAGNAMGEAEGFLEQNAPGSALPEQGRALENMRKGAQALMREMGAGSGKGYGFNDGENSNDLNAPTGHNPFSVGDDTGEGERLPQTADRKTIQDILDEVRRRLSDPQRPKIERDYLERLLRPF